MLERKVFILAILFFFVASCSTKTQEDPPSNDVLDRHRQFSQYTEPGEFAYLYKGLPETLEELCALIKKQLIHPIDVRKFADEIPEGRTYEDRDYPAVSLMLTELLNRNSNGLVESRPPRERLVVACVHHSMLLASILRHRGIPVRIRAGFAKYIGDNKDLRVTHVVCEVWDCERNTWILVDPDRQKIDFPYHEFEFAHETWYRLRNNNINGKYFVSRYGNVHRATVHLLCHDLSYVIGNEEPYWKDPPIVSKVESDIAELSDAERETLDKIAELLNKPEDHLDELAKIQAEIPFLRFGEEL